MTRREEPWERDRVAPDDVLGRIMRALFGSREPGIPPAPPQPPVRPATPWPPHREGPRLQASSPQDRQPQAPPREAPTPSALDAMEVRPLVERAPAREPSQDEPASAVGVRERAGGGAEAPIDPRILAELQHPSVEARLEALRTLAEDPGTAPVVAVTARLQDPDPAVREAAVSLLEATGDERALLLLLDAAADPADQVRRAVRRALLERTSPSLVELLRGELQVPARRRAAAAFLAEMRQTEALLEAARDAGPEIRAAVAEALHGSGAVEDLLADLRDRRPDRRRIAAERLGAVRAAGAVDALSERLLDPDRGVRIKAADALGRIGDPRGLPSLKRALVQDPDTAVAVAVGRAIRAIGGGGDGGPRTIHL